MNAHTEKVRWKLPCNNKKDWKKENFEYKKYSHYNIIQYITDFIRKSMKKVGKISPTSNSHFIRYTDFVDIFT